VRKEINDPKDIAAFFASDAAKSAARCCRSTTIGSGRDRVALVARMTRSDIRGAVAVPN
jgi:hypothetical protein